MKTKEDEQLIGKIVKTKASNEWCLVIDALSLHGLLEVISKEGARFFINKEATVLPKEYNRSLKQKWEEVI